MFIPNKNAVHYFEAIKTMYGTYVCKFSMSNCSFSKGLFQTSIIKPWKSHPRPGIVRTTYSNAAVILVILRSFSEFEELPIASCHLIARFVRSIFVLQYLSFHSLNHGHFQITCAIILSTRCFKLFWVSFRWILLQIQVVCPLFCLYLRFYHYFYVPVC